jgi:hypothetical protein
MIADLKLQLQNTLNPSHDKQMETDWRS